MARTVVYPHKKIEASSSLENMRRPDAREGNVTPTETSRVVEVPGDTYADRLAKFIPGEVIAFYAPLAALVADKNNLLVAAAVIGLIATPVYMVISARKLPDEKKPRLHFYFLATIAFAVWALATSALGTYFNLESVETSFTLMVAVFFIPLLDQLLERKKVENLT